MKRYIKATTKYDIYTDFDDIRAIAQDYGADAEEWVAEERKSLDEYDMEFYGIGVAKEPYFDDLSDNGEDLITVGQERSTGKLVYGIFIDDRFIPVKIN